MNIDFAIMQVESGGNANAHGDIGYHNPVTHVLEEAYGPLQIRQPVCNDVNRQFATNFRASDLLGYTSRSLGIFWLYMAIYATTARLGRPVTDEDRARIWNGGPSAWMPGSNAHALTDPYWNHVKIFLS